MKYLLVFNGIIINVLVWSFVFYVVPLHILVLNKTICVAYCYCVVFNCLSHKTCACRVALQYPYYYLLYSICLHSITYSVGIFIIFATFTFVVHFLETKYHKISKLLYIKPSQPKEVTIASFKGLTIPYRNL